MRHRDPYASARALRAPRLASVQLVVRVALCALVAAGVLATTADARAQAAPGGDYVVRFRERAIDLEPYYEGFPYVNFHAFYDGGRVLYFREHESERQLYTTTLGEGGGALDLARGTRLGAVDWNTRNLRDVIYHAPTRQFLLLADERNEERYNLYALALDDGALTRLTDRPYVFGMGTDKQHHFMGYLPRYGATLPYRACLNLFEISTRQDHEVLCDTPELTFTWSSVNFRPDGAGVVLTALRGTDRNHQNLVYVDLTASPPVQRTLTDASARRRHVGTARDWLDANRFVYTSDESGFTNVYVYDLASGTSRQVTQRTADDVEDVEVLRVGARALVAAIVRRPYESELLVVDPDSGAVLVQRVTDTRSFFLDSDGDHALMTSVSRSTLFALDELTVLPAGGASATLAVRPRAAVPPEVAGAIDQCRIERVQVPTFDVDSRTGHTRMLHAYLQSPRDPPRDPRRRFAFVEAFYGGENVFDRKAQLICAAGGVVLSPSVRGSEGFGAAFAALNDHDLGGNEIIDLVYAGRYLTERFGLREQQVGLIGGSHGGYAVMRAVTLPEEVNGRRERFRWGFGVSYFGISNILTFFEHTNIPDWVLLEAGDPRADRERLLERSPAVHPERAAAPLLLLHGSNDNRVPVRESRQMAEGLRRAHRPVRYVEFEGQGHGLKGLVNQRRIWTETFGFLARTLDHAGAVRGAPRGARAGLRGHRWRALGAVLGVLALIALATWAAKREK